MQHTSYRPLYILTAGQMRAAEERAMGRGIAGSALMERAGAEVLEALLAHDPRLGWAPGRAAVLAGPGNNGGDGYVVARLLRLRGWDVRLFSLAPDKPLPKDAAGARVAFEAAGGKVEPLTAFGPEEAAGRVVVDALFGTGLSRPIPMAAAHALATGGEYGALLVAVDILSGLDADTGMLLAPEALLPMAELTVTFETAKRGHFLGEGPRLSRELAIRPIGIVEDVTAMAGEDLTIVGEVQADTLPLGRLVPRDPLLHKYHRGHLLVMGGGTGKGGAARLAARAGLRIGAGLVTLAVPQAALPENAARLDAVMLAPCESGEDLQGLITSRKITAIALGPGLGLDDRGRELLDSAMNAGLPLVLDADALTLMAERAEDFLARLRAHRARERIVLTPHEGEFRRLFPQLAANPSPIGRVEIAAEVSGAVILLKGAASLIGKVGERPLLHPALYARAVPWLATAGAGDVLTGMIAGLLAGGWPGRAATATAVWLHAEAARRHGPGLIADDIEALMPQLLKDAASGPMAMRI